jgi:hypothetical protein
VTSDNIKKNNIPDCRYREQFGVIVICTDEEHQKQVYSELKKKHRKVKVVVT